MDTTHSTAACSKCKQCGDISVTLLQKKIEEFKAMGCTLFL